MGASQSDFTKDELEEYSVSFLSKIKYFIGILNPLNIFYELFCLL